MIGNLKGITLVVPDLPLTIKHYEKALGAFVTTPQDRPEHGMRLATVKLNNTLIDLITPLGENSPLTEFLKANPDGGVHYLSYEVPDIEKALDQLIALGLYTKPAGEPPIESTENPIVTLSASSFGIAIQLHQTPSVPSIKGVTLDRIGPAESFSTGGPLKGIQGIGIGINVDFKRSTPADNQERE